MISYVKLLRSFEASELIGRPRAFSLLALIATRARRTSAPSPYELEIGEAMISRNSNHGLTESQYRTEKKFLAKGRYATFRQGNRCTLAKLGPIGERIFDINPEKHKSDKKVKAPKRKNSYLEPIGEVGGTFKMFQPNYPTPDEMPDDTDKSTIFQELKAAVKVKK